MPSVTGEPRARLDPEARDVALESLLRNHPDAWVAAIEPSGLFQAMPATVPLRSHHLVEGASSGLELVVPDDQPQIIEAWSRAVAEGAANVTVRPYLAPDRTVTMHFIDATHRYGAYIGVFVGFRGDEVPGTSSGASLVPRTSVMRKDGIAVILGVDEAATRILGWSASELIGRRSLELMHPDDRERAIANWMDMLSRPGSTQRVRLRHAHKDGHFVWLEVTNHNRLNDPDNPCVLADLVDITEEVHALEALRASEHLLRRLTEALPVGVLHLGADGRVNYRNERLCEIVGEEPAASVLQQLDTVARTDRSALRAAVRRVLHDGEDAEIKVSFRPPEGGVRHCEVSLRALTNEAGEVTGAIVCVVDLTEDMNLRATLQQQATYDLLTGCLNHNSVMTALAALLAEPASDRWTVVLFIDLDDFKGINDRYGHAAGDRVLQHVAGRLRRVARGDDLVGRLGGDEFLVAMRIAADAAAVASIAERTANALDTRVKLDDRTLRVRASIGLAYATAGTRVSADALVSAADEAMYASKRQARGVPVNAGHLAA